jgi:hypothetical protein
VKRIVQIIVVLVALVGAQASADTGTATQDKTSSGAETTAAPAKAEGTKKDRDASEEKDAGALSQSSLFGGVSAAPYRGSQIVYRNTLSAVSLDRSTDLTYNPYYAMSWDFRFWWWFSKKFYVRARIGVEHELTESDVTSRANEPLLGDLVLASGFSNAVTIPKAKINISFDLLLTVPTSKASLTRTLVLGVGLGTRVSRSFKVLKGMSLGYNVRGTPKFHRYTTSELETPLIPGCSGTSGCDSFLSSGRRNAMMRVSHYADFSVRILKWLGVSLAVGQAIDWLYPLGDSPEDVSLRNLEPQNRRFITFFDLSVAIRPSKTAEIVLGYSALHPQLAPDSEHYIPFFNRYSAFYLDFKLKIDGLVALVQRSVK